MVVSLASLAIGHFIVAAIGFVWTITVLFEERRSNADELASGGLVYFVFALWVMLIVLGKIAALFMAAYYVIGFIVSLFFWRRTTQHTIARYERAEDKITYEDMVKDLDVTKHIHWLMCVVTMWPLMLTVLIGWGIFEAVGMLFKGIKMLPRASVPWSRIFFPILWIYKRVAITKAKEVELKIKR